MEFSPPKRSRERSKWFMVKTSLSPDNIDTEEKPVLILKPFSAVPHISFNKVKVGSAKSCYLYINNPLDVDQVVRIEKFPKDKGFSVLNEEFFIEAKNQTSVKIVWAPEKAFGCRETVVFRSSTGCKSHAYLLGTAYSPQKKASQRISASKSKTYKKNSPKNGTRSAIGKTVTTSQDLKIYEEKKENLEFFNSRDLSFAHMSENSSFKYQSFFEPRVSFCLKTDNEFPDSPIRRQTYTINSMLLKGRESEILPFRLTEHTENVRIEKEKMGNQSDGNFYRKPFSHQNSYKREVTCSTSAGICDNGDNLNDSLESIKMKANKDDVELNDSLTDLETSYSISSCGNTSIKDSVQTHDVVTKHFYFGFTPQHSTKNSKPEFVEPSGYISHKIQQCGSLDKRNPAIPLDSFVFSNEKRIISGTVSSRCVLDNTNQSEFKEPDEMDFLNYSGYPHNSFHISEHYNKLFSNTVAHDFSVISSKELFEGSNVRSHEQTSGNESKECRLFQSVEGLAEYNDLQGKVVGKTEKALFIEIPNDTPSISSDFSKKSEKHSTFNVLNKHSLRKTEKSSFKAKVTKSRSVTSNKVPVVKGLSVACRTSGIKSKGKPSRFMPKKLNLNISRMTESVVYHRNPFASMNIYYDERWIEKQEAAFTSWLNFILTPNDDFGSENVQVDSAKLWIESIKDTSSAPAPTKEELSLKAYTAARNLNFLRKLSFSLYQSEEVVTVIKKIEKEVDLKRLIIRKDRAIHADLGIKKTILEMLLSYNTLWLRIGLETVYGEVITLQNNSDVLGLSRFIVHRFLHNPEIASKYSHPSVINYYKKGYEDEIHRFTLKKFLLLVFFLDTAKNVHLIKHNPCLFNKNAKYKSSRELLLAFSREYLSGEGDITKHLRHLGYKVSHQQTALEEFDYSVRNLSTDLRCGLRLGRVVEILLQDWTISQMLRINTLNRLTKIHNNDVILKALQRASIEIENNVEAKHITDGDREKTLDLLWQIIFKTQISKLINKDLLKKENAFLCRSLKWRADFAAYNALRKPESASHDQGISILDSKLYKENDTIQLLFQWCQNVCAHYGVKVHNFTSSFSDGRALCLLLHHYHPNVLAYESIKTETSCSYFEQQLETAKSDDNCPFFMKNGLHNSLMEKLLKNEKDNLLLVFQKFQEVGNIPVLSTPSDMSNTMPDEKVMVTLVSYINIRLMELSIEIRAARKILHAWRTYMLKKQRQKLEIEISAVRTIQKVWRRFLAKKRLETQNKAAVVIQCFWKMYCAKRTLDRLRKKKSIEWQTKNAVIIQAAFRGFSWRKYISRCHQAAVVIQACFRQWYTRSRFVKIRNITLKIQRNYRAKVKGKIQKLLYVNTRQHVIKLQAYVRGMLVRRCFRRQQLSAVKIQAYARMWLMSRKYKIIRNACITIQKRFRGYLLTEFYSQEYQNHRAAAIIIQRWYRSVKIQQHRNKSAVKIQAYVRMYIDRKKYSTLLQNVVKLQAWWRAISVGKKTRLSYIQSYKSIVCIQSLIRQYIAARKYKRLKESALIIQKYARAFIAKRKFKKIKENVLKIQKIWRSNCLAKRTRLAYLLYRDNVILAQSVIRRFIATQSFKRKKWAVITIQKNFRASQQQKSFCLLKSNTMLIQRKWRAIILGRKDRAAFLLYRQKVVYIQSVVRQRIAFCRFKRKKQSAVIIQKYIRMWIINRNFLKLKKSAMVVQSWWRNILLGRKLRNNFLMYRKSAIKIQSMYKMHCCKRQFTQLKKSVAVIEHYRIGKMQRNKFIGVRLSVIKLQSMFRCFRYRKRYLKSLNSIILVQACFRRFVQRKIYLKIRASVIRIQSYYHAYKVMCIERQNYRTAKKGIIKLQALYRGWCLRKYIKALSKKATLIQSTYRRWKAQSYYEKLKKSCIIIQKKYRAKLQMKKQYHEFVKIRKAAIKIQALARRHKAHTQFKHLKSSVIKVQSCFRMIKCYRMYHHVKKAAITIQQFYRSYKLMRSIQNDFTQKKLCVILLQSKVRSMIARRSFLQKKKACLLIQSLIRMHIHRKKYIKTHSAVIVIQKYYRNQCLMKIQRTKYIQLRKAAVVTQSHVRSAIARRKFLEQKKACIVIQSCVRMHLQRKEYARIRNATVFLQRYYRNQRLMKVQRNKYVNMIKATILIQSIVRSFIARKRFLHLKKACILMQSALQAYILRKKYVRARNAAIFIQRYFRNYLLMKAQRNIYTQQRKAIIFLQSKVRSAVNRKEFLKQKNACISIQSFVRMYLQQKKYKKICQATVSIQKYYHCWKLMKVQRSDYLLKRKAIILLQSAFRAVYVRKKYLKLKKSSIVIQSFVKMFIHKIRYNRVRNATLVIQKYFRSYKISSEIRKNYLSLRTACIIIQSYFRMHKCQKEFISLHSSVIFIQKKYRAKLEAQTVKQNFLTLKASCIKMQAFVRMVLAKKNFLKVRNAAVTVQSHYRCYIARKKYIHLRNSVITIQKYFVAWKTAKIVRREFLSLKSSVITVQSAVRSYLTKKSFKLQKKACIKIQAYIRKHLCRKTYMKKRNATLILQKHARAYILSKKVREDFVHTKRCVVRIQAFVRGFLVRHHLRKLHYSATKIQAVYRTHIARLNYIKQKKSAIIIQKYFRSLLLMKKIQQEYVNLRTSAIIIQSTFKKYRERREFLSKKAAIIVLQAHVRKFIAQSQFNKFKKSVCVIENHYIAYKIGLKEHQLYQKKRESCVKIQALWRSYAVRKRLRSSAEAAIKIQRAFRLWKERKVCKNMRSLILNQANLPNELVQHLWFIYLRKGIIDFQQAARTYLLKRHKAATIIQSHLRMWIVQQQYKKIKAAVKIQACWRAYIVRRSITDDKVSEARKKIKAADSTESKKLKNRTTRSLDLLFKNTALLHMLSALQELDACTRLSPKCCERLVESDGLKIFIQLLTLCNRSCPHMELIKLTANILLNLSKYEKTVDCVWEEEGSVETVLQLMKKFREKGTVIFTKCCTLLWIFSQDPRKAKIMQQDSTVVEQIRSFHYLLTRKQSLEDKRLVSKTVAAKSFKSSNLSKIGNTSECQSLQIDPDWILGRHRRREFEDPVVAITYVMKSLNIKGRQM